MKLTKRINRAGTRYSWFWLLGKEPGQRPSLGVFTYVNPKTPIERAHNKQIEEVLKVKESQGIVEASAIGTPYIPKHKFKANFMEFYEDYVKKHRRFGNRALENSLAKFKVFVGRDFITPKDVTEDLCKLFRSYLLDNLKGETPQNYFGRFKEVVNTAKKQGYFFDNPVEKVAARKHPSQTKKELLEIEDYQALLSTPWIDTNVSDGFIFCCYTGLRFVDVYGLKWRDVRNGQVMFKVIQEKTEVEVNITLHPIAVQILDMRKALRKRADDDSERIFHLKSLSACSKSLQAWVDTGGIKKKIGWSNARLSFSVLLQDNMVDTATVAYLLGHTTTRQVERIYKRHRPKNMNETIARLPEGSYLHS